MDRRSRGHRSVFSACLDDDDDLLVDLFLARDANASHAASSVARRDPLPQDTNDSGQTALHIASSSGSFRCLNTLIRNGADINARDIENAYTAMHCGAFAGHVGILLSGLRIGAVLDDPSAQSLERYRQDRSRWIGPSTVRCKPAARVPYAYVHDREGLVPMDLLLGRLKPQIEYFSIEVGRARKHLWSIQPSQPSKDTTAQMDGNGDGDARRSSSSSRKRNKQKSNERRRKNSRASGGSSSGRRHRTRSIVDVDSTDDEDGDDSDLEPGIFQRFAAAIQSQDGGHDSIANSGASSNIVSSVFDVHMSPRAWLAAQRNWADEDAVTEACADLGMSGGQRLGPPSAIAAASIAAASDKNSSKTTTKRQQARGNPSPHDGPWVAVPPITFCDGAGASVGHGGEGDTRANWFSTGCYSWGKADFQLGYSTTGDAQLQPKSVDLRNTSSHNDDTDGSHGRPTIVAATAGRYHTILLTSTGCPLVFGVGQGGRLGLDQSDSRGQGHVQLQPATITYFPAHRLVVTHVSAGDRHSLAVTSQGWVFAWGDNRSGACGVGNQSGAEAGAAGSTSAAARVDRDANTIPAPRRIEGQLKRLRITSACAGAYHSVAVSSNGEGWSWGSNWTGQLGIRDLPTGGPGALSQAPPAAAFASAGVTPGAAGKGSAGSRAAEPASAVSLAAHVAWYPRKMDPLPALASCLRRRQAAAGGGAAGSSFSALLHDDEDDDDGDGDGGHADGGISTGSRLKQVSASDSYTLALTGDGEVWCTGNADASTISSKPSCWSRVWLDSTQADHEDAVAAYMESCQQLQQAKQADAAASAQSASSSLNRLQAPQPSQGNSGKPGKQSAAMRAVAATFGSPSKPARPAPEGDAATASSAPSSPRGSPAPHPAGPDSPRPDASSPHPNPSPPSSPTVNPTGAPSGDDRRSAVEHLSRLGFHVISTGAGDADAGVLAPSASSTGATWSMSRGQGRGRGGGGGSNAAAVGAGGGADAPSGISTGSRGGGGSRTTATSISAGKHVALVLDSDGCVWSWCAAGKEELLGLGVQGSSTKQAGTAASGSCSSTSTAAKPNLELWTPPRRVSSLARAGMRVTSVCAGVNHCVAVTNDGCCYSWGSASAGERGLLGHGTGKGGLAGIPRRLQSIQQVVHACAAEGHTIATTALFQPPLPPLRPSVNDLASVMLQAGGLRPAVAVQTMIASAAAGCKAASDNGSEAAPTSSALVDLSYAIYAPVVVDDCMAAGHVADVHAYQVESFPGLDQQMLAGDGKGAQQGAAVGLSGLSGLPLVDGEVPQSSSSLSGQSSFSIDLPAPDLKASAAATSTSMTQAPPSPHDDDTAASHNIVFTPPSLRSLCERVLARSVTLSTAMSTLALAQDLHSGGLAAYCGALINANAPAVMAYLSQSQAGTTAAAAAAAGSGSTPVPAADSPVSTQPGPASARDRELELFLAGGYAEGLQRWRWLPPRVVASIRAREASHQGDVAARYKACKRREYGIIRPTGSWRGFAWSRWLKGLAVSRHAEQVVADTIHGRRQPGDGNGAGGDSEQLHPQLDRIIVKDAMRVQRALFAGALHGGGAEDAAAGPPGSPQPVQARPAGSRNRQPAGSLDLGPGAASSATSSSAGGGDGAGTGRRTPAASPTQLRVRASSNGGDDDDHTQHQYHEPGRVTFESAFHAIISARQGNTGDALAGRAHEDVHDEEVTQAHASTSAAGGGRRSKSSASALGAGSSASFDAGDASSALQPHLRTTLPASAPPSVQASLDRLAANLAELGWGPGQAPTRHSQVVTSASSRSAAINTSMADDAASLMKRTKQLRKKLLEGTVLAVQAAAGKGYSLAASHSASSYATHSHVTYGGHLHLGPEQWSKLARRSEMAVEIFTVAPFIRSLHGLASELSRSAGMTSADNGGSSTSGKHTPASPALVSSSTAAGASGADASFRNRVAALLEQSGPACDAYTSLEAVGLAPADFQRAGVLLHVGHAALAGTATSVPPDVGTARQLVSSAGRLDRGTLDQLLTSAVVGGRAVVGPDCLLVKDSRAEDNNHRQQQQQQQVQTEQQAPRASTAGTATADVSRKQPVASPRAGASNSGSSGGSHPSLESSLMAIIAAEEEQQAATARARQQQQLSKGRAGPWEGTTSAAASSAGAKPSSSASSTVPPMLAPTAAAAKPAAASAPPSFAVGKPVPPNAARPAPAPAPVPPPQPPPAAASAPRSLRDILELESKASQSKAAAADRAAQARLAAVVAVQHAEAAEAAAKAAMTGRIKASLVPGSSAAPPATASAAVAAGAPPQRSLLDIQKEQEQNQKRLAAARGGGGGGGGGYSSAVDRTKNAWGWTAAVSSVELAAGVDMVAIQAAAEEEAAAAAAREQRLQAERAAAEQKKAGRQQQQKGKQQKQQHKGKPAGAAPHAPSGAPSGGGGPLPQLPASAPAAARRQHQPAQHTPQQALPTTGTSGGHSGGADPLPGGAKILSAGKPTFSSSASGAAAAVPLKPLADRLHADARDFVPSFLAPSSAGVAHLSSTGAGGHQGSRRS